MKPIAAGAVVYRFIPLLLVALLASGCRPGSKNPPPVTETAKPSGQPATVTLTMGSWRTEDVLQMNRILAGFSEKHPNISVKYDPTSAPQYDAALRAQLEGGTAPDLVYLRSYAISRSLFEQGYLEPLDDLPGLKERFAADMLAPWATEDGKPYGVPFIATSHGIYYNLDLFNRLHLSVPATWEGLLELAGTIRDEGVIPFSNASGNEWTMAEIVFMNLAPNFIGGRTGRMEYLEGKRCFDDARVVAAFQAVADISPYLPENQDLLTYSDSQQLFLQGQAAMFMGGSWEIPFFEAENPAFAWSVFAPPPPAGQPGYLTFHLDAGLGLNAASRGKEEARKLLEWMCTPELAGLLGNELPGFFPMHREAPVLANEHAKAFLALNRGRGTDVRFAWEKLREGSPDGYTLMRDGAVAVAGGRQTPRQAADALQAGLVQWFEPAKRCGR